MFDFLASESILQTFSIIIALSVSALTTIIIVPPLMRKMKERGITGTDWNKRDRRRIPELGGIAMLFGFPIGVSIASGVLKLFDSFIATPILAAIGVLFIAGMIGIIDDISNIPQRIKAIVLAFAALPLILSGSGNELIRLPFGVVLDFSISDELSLLFWLLIVPIGIAGASNAINMSAGYNGLETGEIVIISFSLLGAALVTDGSIECMLILSAVMGAALGLNYFNGYPALTFVGDVGTLSMGAVIGASAIIGGLEFAGVIAIAPAFYEAVSTVYYSQIKKIDRKKACSTPIIDEDGKMHPPKGAEKYTLAFLILSMKPMREKELVRTILLIYMIAGIFAIIFATVG